MKKSIKRFIKSLGFSPNDVASEELIDAINFIQRLEGLVSALDKNNPRSQIEISLTYIYRRNYKYCLGVISSMLSGQPKSCEVLCRTLLEGGCKPSLY